MSKARPDDLTYGHLGKATYDPKSEKWYFQRVPGIRHFLQPVADPVTSLDSTLLDVPSGSKQSAKSRAKYIRDLVKSEPGIAPAAFLLPALAQVSEAVIDATAAADPTTSRLVAFGTAADIENKHSGSRRVDILAIVGGPAGEAIRILKVGRESFNWLGHKGVTLSAPTIDTTEQGWWVGNGTPIQQVCFSEENGRPGGWLAVRYSGATSILRPLILRYPVAAGFAHSKNGLVKHFSPSRLDTNQVVHLSINKTGGAQHTDVAFNPWNQRRFAVLDVRGHWSVWDIEGKYSKRNQWTVTSVSSRTPSEFQDNQHSTGIGDGWGSILWAGDTTVLVVASRSNILICSIALKSERFSGPELGVTDGSDWILDVRRSPVNPSHIFVLTSLCIYWLKVDSGNGQHAGSQFTPSLEILLARRHFRSQEDRSLKMLVHVQSEVSEIILQSSQTDLVTVFEFAMVRSIQLPQSISDPYVVPIENGRTDSSAVTDASDASLPQVRKKGLASLLICSVPYTVLETVESSNQGSILMDAGVRFCKMFMLYSDLSVSERLYTIVEQGQELKGEFLPLRSLQHHAKTSAWTMDSNFTVGDVFPIDYERTGLEKILPGQDRSVFSHGTSNQRKNIWTVDFEWLAKNIGNGIPTKSEQNVSAKAFVGCLQRSIDHLVMENTRIQSIYELLGDVSIKNIDNASGLLQGFLNGIHDRTIIPSADLVGEMEPDHHLSVRSLLPITMANAFYDHKDYDDETSLMPIYETVLNTWIKPLRSYVPGRTRVDLEKRLRKISIQLYLSCQGLQYGLHVYEHENPTTLTNVEDTEFALPLRRKPSATTFLRKDEEIAQESSQTQPIESANQEYPLNVPAMLPTPEPTPSLHSQHSQNSASSITSTNSAPYRRLQALASIEPQPALSGSLTQLLSHWRIGDDPLQYSWTDTQKSLIQSDAEDGISLKRQQRLEKRLKRQRQESHGSSSQQSSAWLFSSQPQTSQVLQSSSQVVEPPLPNRHLEQMNRNAPTPKRRKPDRKAGF
ncbi:hypothetical protein MMC11_002231 [Xylographa trunciseda]|nr:hypothetical protein [Xylographa trunciseda]